MKSKLFKEYTSNVDTNMTSVFTSVKNKITSSIDTYKFNLKWHDRNKQYGEIIVKTLEVDAILFQDYIFVEATPEILKKLDKFDFIPVTGFKHESLIKKFSCTVYNDKYNVAISLYNSDAKHAVTTAHKIIKTSCLEVLAKYYLVSLVVFSTIITQLMEDT